MADQITLFADKNFKGASVVITDAVPDLSHSRYNFNDKASSAKVEGSAPWTLYLDADFKGKQAILQPGDHPDLKLPGLNDAVSSLKPAASKKEQEEAFKFSDENGDDWFYFENTTT